MSINLIKDNLEQAKEVINTFLNQEENLNKIDQAAETMAAALQNGQKVISCGNGGSMCDAMHFAEELSGRFRKDRKPLAAVSISDPSHISCVGNDYGYDFIFSRYIQALGQKGDVLLAISTSGNSSNIIKAIEAAKTKGMKVIGLSGKDGGKMAALCDLEIRAPHSAYADRAQELHIKIIHCFIQLIEVKLGLSE